MKILGNICIAVGVYLLASVFILRAGYVLDIPVIIGLGFIGILAIFGGTIMRKAL
jgi:hypothetical protein